MRRLATCESLIAAPTSAVMAVIGDLERHWELLGPLVTVARLERDTNGHPVGAELVVRGPCGSRRRVRTRVESVDARSLVGLAVAGRSGAPTRARVRWRVEPAPSPGTTRVQLEIAAVELRAFDRTLVLLGGRRLLQRIAAHAVAALAATVDADEGARNPRAVTPRARRWR